MAIPLDEVPTAARNALAWLLAENNVSGYWRPLDGCFVGPSPRADKKHQRTYQSELLVRRDGSWSDRHTGDRGGDAISLFGYITHTSSSGTLARLSTILTPTDLALDQAVKLTSRENPYAPRKQRKAEVRDTPGELMQKLDQAGICNARIKADALVQLARANSIKHTPPR